MKTTQTALVKTLSKARLPDVQAQEDPEADAVAQLDLTDHKATPDNKAVKVVQADQVTKVVKVNKEVKDPKATKANKEVKVRSVEPV